MIYQLVLPKSRVLNNDAAAIDFEKANSDIEGLYQLINQWFCQKVPGNFELASASGMIAKCIVQI